MKPKNPDRLVANQGALTSRLEDFLVTLQKADPSIEGVSLVAVPRDDLKPSTWQQTCHVQSKTLKQIKGAPSPLETDSLPQPNLDKRVEGFLHTLQHLYPGVAGIAVQVYRLVPANDEYIGSYSQQTAYAGSIAQPQFNRPHPRITHAEHNAKLVSVKSPAADTTSSKPTSHDSYVDMSAATNAAMTAATVSVSM